MTDLDGRATAGAAPSRAFAALDLGTNNCRLLIAEPVGEGFRVVDGYSQIVRLGEGLAHSGRLCDAAIGRTMHALSTCAARIAARPVEKVRLHRHASMPRSCRTEMNSSRA